MARNVKPVKTSRLTEELVEIGYDKNSLKLERNSDTIGRGLLSFGHDMNGLSVHCCDMVESANGSNCVNLPAMISINILFSGTVKFQLNDQKFQFEAEQANCFFNFLPNNTTFTRYFSKDNEVKKLNITLSESWLDKRCSHWKEKQLVKTMLSNNAKVVALPLDSELVCQAKALFDLKLNTSLANNIQVELSALQLVVKLLSKMKKQRKSYLIKRFEVRQKNNIAIEECGLLMQLNELIDLNLSLQLTAKKLGMSASTLQRKIKQKHGFTVQEYMRKQKLQVARNAIVFDHLSIGEAAFNAGYNHVSNFITAFKKQFGVSPAKLKP